MFFDRGGDPFDHTMKSAFWMSNIPIINIREKLLVKCPSLPRNRGWYGRGCQRLLQGIGKSIRWLTGYHCVDYNTTQIDDKTHSGLSLSSACAWLVCVLWVVSWREAGKDWREETKLSFLNQLDWWLSSMASGRLQFERIKRLIRSITTGSRYLSGRSSCASDSWLRPLPRKWSWRNLRAFARPLRKRSIGGGDG